MSSAATSHAPAGSADLLASARQRIQSAYAPDLFADTAQRWARLLGEHLRHVEAGQGPVLNWHDPEPNTATATSYLDHREPATADRAADLLQVMLSRGHNLHHPHYVGHQVPPPVPLAGLFDALGSVTNQVMAIYEMGPWAAAIERSLVGKLLEQIGWSLPAAAGIVTHGGAVANLTGLLAARNVSIENSWDAGLSGQSRPPVLVVQGDAHYSLGRAAGVLGLGTRQVLKAPLDDRRRMDPQQLDDLLTRLRAESIPIVAVGACACATPIGAFDPLADIAAVCRKHDVWLHVDAAHGGAALFSARHRHLLQGLDQAESVVWDAHKMLFVPALSAFVLYRQQQNSYRAFQQEAQYLFDPSAPDMRDYDGGLRTLECTKRAATYGLWGLWSLFGPQLFADLVDVTFDLARQFHQKLQAADDFEVLHEPQCNILVFRYTPAALREAPPQVLSDFQFQLRRRVIQSGEFYLVATVFNGVAALRVTLINPLTTNTDLDQLLATLRDQGRRLLEESHPK